MNQPMVFCVRKLLAIVVCVLLWATCAAAQQPTPGQNVNMVSGTTWPFGDPFLQRQNEPSMAVSTRNELHLLAGANDYRTVDLPASDVVPGSLAGDAWLGVFKSFDGGRTWQSTLIPGYPQDNSPAGLASPLKGFSTGADPVVRAHNSGLFLYAGMAFNRGTNNGVVFIARYMDLANKENGSVAAGTDPIRYIDTKVVDTGTSGQFLDKLWLMVDAPVAGAPTCSIAVPTGPNQTTTQNIPAGRVYLVWSRFTGSGGTKIMLSVSTDCGANWSLPIKLSESNNLNQGTIGAIDPQTHDLHIAWRRFKTSSETDAIMYVRASSNLKNVTKASVIANINPFDQQTTSGSFRTNTLPTVAVSVDSNNNSRVHVAWAARPAVGDDCGGVKCSRIMISTSSNGGGSWTAPAVIDSGPVFDDVGNPFTRGHQFMPQMTVVGGLVSVAYYDSRFDHTMSRYTPNNPFVPDASGKFYTVTQDPKGELPANPNAVYTPFLTDAGLTMRRHTIDLRLAQAVAGPTLNWVFSSITKYNFGMRGDEVGTVTDLSQLQVDPPNFQMFALGTVPFLGDYIDLVGVSFLLDPATGTWKFNVAPSKKNTVFATWTDNRDVRPPPDGDWTKYTPVGGGGQSIYDPTQNTPACVTGYEGTRNQNIYMSPISQGLQVTVPQNFKPLSTTLTRAFTVITQNFTNTDRTFRWTIANQPQGGKASFLSPDPPPGTPTTSLDITIPAHSGAVRTVFATSSNALATISVNVDEISGPGGSLVANGLSSFALLNADPTVPQLLNPDGSGLPDIASQELYNVNVSNANVSNANVSNVNVSNTNISNVNVSNTNVSNVNVSNPDIAVVNVSNTNISNSNVSNTNISNPNISNVNVSNQPVSDATYSVSNTGNTTTAFSVNLVGNATVSSGGSLQLIVSQPYQNPIGLGCQLLQQQQNGTAANINAPVFKSFTNISNTNIGDSSPSNATFALAPGETALVTVRGVGVDLPTLDNVTSTSAPATVTQAPNPGGNAVAVPLLITTTSLPDGTVGGAYSTNIEAIGGTQPYSIPTIPNLPQGLTLSAANATCTSNIVPCAFAVLSGTPTTAGTYTITFFVADSGSPQGSNKRTLTLTVLKAATTTTITSDNPDPSYVGQPVTVNFSTTVNPPGGGTPTGTVTVTVNDGSGATCTAPVSAAGTCDITLTQAGTWTLTATYPGDSNYLGSAGTASHVVNKAPTTTTITSDAPDPSILGQPVPVYFTVTSQSGFGTPTGNVTVSDGVNSCTATVATGNCTLTFTTVGTRTLTATYAGDNNFLGSSGTASHQVFYQWVGFFPPNAVAGTASSPSYSGTANFGSAVPLKFQLKDFSGTSLSSLSNVQAITAVFNGNTCSGPPAGPTLLIYSPTVGATGNSTFRWDPTNQQYTVSWDSSSATSGKGCYAVEVQTNDGSPIKATYIKLQ